MQLLLIITSLILIHSQENQAGPSDTVQGMNPGKTPEINVKVNTGGGESPVYRSFLERINNMKVKVDSLERRLMSEEARFYEVFHIIDGELGNLADIQTLTVSNIIHQNQRQRLAMKSTGNSPIANT